MSALHIPKAAPGFWPLAAIFAAFGGLYLSTRYLGRDGGDIFFHWLFIAGAFVSAGIAIRAILRQPRESHRASVYAAAAGFYALLAVGDVFPKSSTIHWILRTAALFAVIGYSYLGNRARTAPPVDV